jgi:hypothetical protein
MYDLWPIYRTTSNKRIIPMSYVTTGERSSSGRKDMNVHVLRIKMFQKLCFMVQVAQLSASTDHKFMAQ